MINKPAGTRTTAQWARTGAAHHAHHMPGCAMRTHAAAGEDDVGQAVRSHQRSRQVAGVAAAPVKCVALKHLNGTTSMGAGIGKVVKQDADALARRIKCKGCCLHAISPSRHSTLRESCRVHSTESRAADWTPAASAGQRTCAHHGTACHAAKLTYVGASHAQLQACRRKNSTKCKLQDLTCWALRRSARSTCAR